jgi:hypothetical protein
MAIIANIVKRGTRKEKQEVEKQPVASLKTIHELYNRDTGHKKQVGNSLEKPKRRSTVQETNEINIKKTSRYLEDLTNKGDN